MTARIVEFQTGEGIVYCIKRGMQMSPEFANLSDAVMWALERRWGIVE